MTEQEWVTGLDPAAMLRWLNRPRGDRKLLLYAVAWARENWEQLILEDSRKAVEWVERYADGLAERDEEYRRLEWRSEGAAFRLESQAQSESIAMWSKEAESNRKQQLKRLTGHIDAEPPYELRRQIAAAYIANALMTGDADVVLDRIIQSGVLLHST